ncbi:hypothetical protein GGR56DRAFT_668600 [Xylariaceae sp. FL0804]|nr:hypothetical protein GGR56DRAFT_668600 [Xylariaceae sp. FL0804]
MCIEVWCMYTDPACNHKRYQNTCPCPRARRCSPDDERMLLSRPVFLPAEPPKLPSGMLGCRTLKATRPTSGKCEDCAQPRPHSAGKRSPATTTITTTTTTTPRTATPTPPSGSSSSDTPSSKSKFASLSPDSQAIARVRDSFLRLTEQQRVTPPPRSSPDGRLRGGSTASSGSLFRPGS